MSIEKLTATQQHFLADGGLETFMIFQEGIDLPHFASSALFETDEGRKALNDYFERFISIAREAGRGFVLDTATWRSGLAWADVLGRSPDEMLERNKQAVAFAGSLRDRNATADLPIVINGVVGPAGDGYAPEKQLAAEDAYAVHLPQIRSLAEAGVDMISAVTMTHTGEAIGIARAASSIGMPVVISFTVETDGRLPSGQDLGAAINEVDAATDQGPLYYMINCAHPDHFRDAIMTSESWIDRIGGIRANASRMSHAELDVADELDDGDPDELGRLHAELLEMLPNIRVLGGCCGTDHRHVGCMADARNMRSAA